MGVLILLFRLRGIHDGPEIDLADYYTNNRLLLTRSHQDRASLLSCAKDRTWLCKIIATDGNLTGPPAVVPESGTYAFATEADETAGIEVRTEDDAVIRHFSTPGTVWGLKFFPDRQRLLAIVSRHTRPYSMGGTTSTDYQLAVFDLKSGGENDLLTELPDKIYSVAFLSDSRLVWTGTKFDRDSGSIDGVYLLDLKSKAFHLLENELPVGEIVGTVPNLRLITHLNQRGDFDYGLLPVRFTDTAVIPGHRFLSLEYVNSVSSGPNLTALAATNPNRANGTNKICFVDEAGKVSADDDLLRAIEMTGIPPG